MYLRIPIIIMHGECARKCKLLMCRENMRIPALLQKKGIYENLYEGKLAYWVGDEVVAGGCLMYECYAVSLQYSFPHSQAQVDQRETKDSQALRVLRAYLGQLDRLALVAPLALTAPMAQE